MANVAAPPPRTRKLERFHGDVQRLRRWLRISETTWLFLLAALAGVSAGTGSIVFHYLIAGVQWLAFGSPHGSAPTLVLAHEVPSWRVLLAPVIGGLIVGPLIWFFAREAKGHGVPAVVRAVHERGGRISPVIALVKTIASALTLGSGGSLGREGPVIQIGASLGSAVGQLLGVTPKQLKMLAAAGAAGGLAAMFNAPLGGAFFSLEVILGTFAMDAFGPVVVASVTATVVSRAILGDKPNIVIDPYQLKHSYELLVYVVLGIASGAVAVVFTRGVAAATAAFERVPFAEWIKPAFGGAAVGLMALEITPRVLGNGYETIDALATGQPIETIFLVLLGAKLVATCVTLGSGGSGGVFGPSLFLGAVLGAFVGKMAHFVAPDVAPPAAYAIVGMAAFTAGATHAPVSMALMLFEMTDDYKIVLPLLISTSIASMFARKLYAESVDTVLDARRGVHVHKNVEEMALHAVRVDEAGDLDAAAALRPNARLDVVLDRFFRARTSVVAIVASDGQYLGVILLDDVKEGLADLKEAGSTVIAHDLMRQDVRTLAPDMPLTLAIDALHGAGCDALPVVDPASGRFVGFLSEGHVVAAYRRSILRSELQSTLFMGTGSRTRARVDLPPGIALTTAPVPSWLVGRTLRESNLRFRYGVLVLATIAKDAKGQPMRHFPDPGAPLASGEQLVVLGPEQSISAIQKGKEPPLATADVAEAVTRVSQRLSVEELENRLK